MTRWLAGVMVAGALKSVDSKQMMPPDAVPLTTAGSEFVPAFSALVTVFVQLWA